MLVKGQGSKATARDERTWLFVSQNHQNNECSTEQIETQESRVGRVRDEMWEYVDYTTYESVRNNDGSDPS